MMPAAAERSFVLGCDLASPQGHNVDFDSLGPEGLQFLIPKGAQGERYVDPTFVRNAREACRTREFVSAYLWPEPRADPYRQAKHFASSTASTCSRAR